MQVVATPAVGDFNSDGRLEVAYSVVWSSAFPSWSEAAPQLKVFAFTLEDRFRQLMEEEVISQTLVDFDKFLPADQQPWNRYMGHRGNSVFTRKDSAVDNPGPAH